MRVKVSTSPCLCSLVCTRVDLAIILLTLLLIIDVCSFAFNAVYSAIIHLSFLYRHLHYSLHRVSICSHCRSCGCQRSEWVERCLFRLSHSLVVYQHVVGRWLRQGRMHAIHSVVVRETTAETGECGLLIHACATDSHEMVGLIG